MELKAKVNHQRIAKKEMIPGLTKDLSKKRYVFSKKYHGKNLKIRFTFSKIKSGEDYVSMLDQCRKEAEMFEKEIDDHEEIMKNKLKLKLEESKRRRDLYCRMHNIEIDERITKFLKKIDKKTNRRKENNSRRTTLRIDKKRNKFKNSITRLMKISIVENIKNSRESQEELDEINNFIVKYDKLTPTIYFKMIGILQSEGTYRKNNKELGTVSLIKYLQSKKFNYQY